MDERSDLPEEDFLKQALNTVPEAISYVDAGQIFRYVNRRFVEIFDKRGVEIIGRSMQDVFPEEEYTKIRKHLNEAFSGETVEQTISLPSPRENQRTLHLRHIPDFGGGNRIHGVLTFAAEVTDRIQGNSALQEKEENYGILIENVPAVLWKSDHEGRTDFISPNVEGIYGFTQKEIYKSGKKLFLDRIHPDDIGRVKRAWEQLFARQNKFDIEYRIRHKDGRYIRIHDRAVKIVDEINKQYVVGLFTDITEKHRIEKELRHSEEKYKRLTENARDMIYRMSLPDGVYEYVSPASTEIFGYSPEEFYKSPLLVQQAIHPDWHGYFAEQWEKLLQGRMPPEYEYQIIHRSGEIRWLNQRNVLITGNDGKPKAIEGIVTDITSHKKAEEALIESETNLRQAQEIAMLGHYVFNVSSETWSCSPTLDHIFGISPDYEKTVEGWLELIHPDDREEMSAYLRDHVITKGNLFDKEYRIIRKSDGATRWVHGKGDLRISRDGAPQTMFGIIQDITTGKEAQEKNKLLQEQLTQAQKLEAVGRLAGGVAHDFNNLLTGITGYTELLLSDLRDGDPMENDLMEIKKAADRAASLTAQLLAFSRKQVISPRAVNLNSLVDNSTKMITRLIGEDVEVVFVPDNSLGSVNVDPHQIEQVLINLAINARDAMPEGGKLLIETANTTIDTKTAHDQPGAKPGSYVLLSVSDTGCGIPPDIRKHLFEPFFTTKGKDKGTGLGLSMIYGIIQQNYGFIDVNSETGKGSTFHVYLPRSDDRVEAPLKPAEKAPPIGRESILLIEDEPMVRALARQVLIRHGYQVLVVDKADQAVALAEDASVKIDLLLTDVIMPDMNGLQVYERISPLRPRLRVLYMSGYPEQTIAHQGILQENTHFIQKPFSIDNLVRKVREVLDASPGQES